MTAALRPWCLLPSDPCVCWPQTLVSAGLRPWCLLLSDPGVCWPQTFKVAALRSWCLLPSDPYVIFTRSWLGLAALPLGTRLPPLSPTSHHPHWITLHWTSLHCTEPCTARTLNFTKLYCTTNYTSLYPALNCTELIATIRCTARPHLHSRTWPGLPAHAWQLHGKFPEKSLLFGGLSLN